jgi:hypothetical protein
MDDWKLQDRELRLGSDVLPESVIRYNNRVAYFPEYLNKTSKLVLKVSDNKQFAAVYDEAGHYCEFFQQEPNSHIRDDRTYPYNSHRYLFTLKRDTYRQYHFLVAFVTQQDGTVRLVFNKEHNSLTVYELPSGKIIHEEIPHISEFLGYIHPLNIPNEPAERYWYCGGWCWGPVSLTHILDMKAISNGELHQAYIKYDDPNNKNNGDSDDDDDADDTPFTAKNGTIYYKEKELVFDSIGGSDKLKFFKYVDKN